MKDLNLTSRSKERLIENDPIYKYLDYYVMEDGVERLRTITVEEYRRLSDVDNHSV